MTQNGVMTSIYIQKDIEISLKNALNRWNLLYKSKNHLINAALSLFLRLLSETNSNEPLFSQLHLPKEQTEVKKCQTQTNGIVQAVTMS